jgi:KipI family sensor histidine kinase inhibitor
MLNNYSISVFVLNSKQFELQWPEMIDVEILQSKISVREFLEKEYAEIIRDIREGYATLSIRLKANVALSNWQELMDEINSIVPSPLSSDVKTWTIPVCYGGTFGKDLRKVAEIKKLSEKEIIALHELGEYQLHFYGFLPGFMYLGGLNERLYIPRKESPDPFIPSGTVAIGGKQTGVYPLESPGGWYALGRTPIHLADFSINICRPVAGDKVRFKEIDEKEYRYISEAIQAGKYTWQHDPST